MSEAQGTGRASHISERFTLIRPGALGDALLTLPTLALLRRERPGAQVTLVARGDVLPLARASGLADASWPFDDPIWYALFDELPRGGTAFNVIEDSAVVAWMGDADGAVHRALERLGANEIVLAESRPAEGSGVHTALYLARALAPLGIAFPAMVGELTSLLPRLIAPDADEAAADAAWQALGVSRDARVVALHAGSGGAAKRWPPRLFAAVADGLRSMGYWPLLIEGPQDAVVTAEVIATVSGEAPAITRGLSVGALASLLRRCAAYLGNDSGVTHLAALVGVPTVALFGPSDPALWSPIGERVAVVRSATGVMTGIGVDEVMRALCGLLAAG